MIHDDIGFAEFQWLMQHDATERNPESYGNSRLLVSGLDAGDRIVIAGVSFLTEGQKVRIPAE
jgi:hypothetical protein